MNELTVKNFDTLELNELETIDGDLSWRDVATAGSAIAGAIIGGAVGAVGGVVTGGANGAIGGWIGVAGIGAHLGMASPI